MAHIIQLRRDTSENFTESNIILAQGEPAIEIDTKKEKIGDGITAWNDLEYRFNNDQGEGARRRKVIAVVDNTAAPPTEVLNDRYILDFTGASHADWNGAAAGDIVQYNGTVWVSTTPEEGWVAYVDDENADYRFVDDGVPEWEIVNTPDLSSYMPIANFKGENLISSGLVNLTASGVVNVDFTTKVYAHLNYTATGSVTVTAPSLTNVGDTVTRMIKLIPNSNAVGLPTSITDELADDIDIAMENILVLTYCRIDVSTIDLVATLTYR